MIMAIAIIIIITIITLIITMGCLNRIHS